MTFNPIYPSKENVEEFKEIFQKEYGRKLTDEEANESAYSLLNFFKLLLEVDERNKRQEKANGKK